MATNELIMKTGKKPFVVYMISFLVINSENRNYIEYDLTQMNPACMGQLVGAPDSDMKKI